MRLLFPGNAPQHVIIHALEKVKDFEILSCPIYKIKPAPEPVVHTIKKAPVANGTKAPLSATNGSTKTEKTLTTTSKSSLSSKPPMPKIEKTNGMSTASKTSQNATTSNGIKSTNGSSAAKAKPVPKSAPVTASKKPVSATLLPKKTDSSITSNKANTSKTEPKANTSKTEPKASLITTKTTTTSSTRLNNASATKPTAAALPKKPTASKTSSEEKPRAINAKRDPKPSSAKPSTSKTNDVKKTATTKKSTVAPVVVVETKTVNPVIKNDSESMNVIENKVENHESTMKQDEPEQCNDEWPNLSPVKHDQNDQNENTMDSHYMEDRNNSIDVNNESGIDADTECKERKEMNFLISDAKDLIQTPENEIDVSFDKYQNNDVMTRSFIDNGEVNSNPFANKAAEAAEEKRLKEAEDSLNDLNKTHELSDYEPVIEQSEPSVGQSTPVVEQSEPLIEQSEPIVEQSEPVVEQSEPIFEKMVETCVPNIESPEQSEQTVEEKPLVIDENALINTEVSEEAILQNNESNQQENNVKEVSGLDDLLEGLNTLSIDAKKNDMENGITKNGQDHEHTNGHTNGHANGHGDSEIEDGEIVDNDEPQMEKIIIKTGQEPISSGVTQVEDPTKWNLLELPKPVNPNELPVPPVHDRKSFTPNGLFNFIKVIFSFFILVYLILILKVRKHQFHHQQTKINLALN